MGDAAPRRCSRLALRAACGLACLSVAGCTTDPRKGADAQSASRPPPARPAAAPRSSSERLAELLEQASARCYVNLQLCDVRDCVDELDRVEQSVTQEPALFELLTERVRGGSATSVVALYFANGVLTRWRRDGIVREKLGWPRHRAFVQASLANPCSGVLLAPLLFPKGALGPDLWAELDAGR